MKDLNFMILGTYLKADTAGRSMTPAMGRKRQTDPWRMLASPSAQSVSSVRDPASKTQIDMLQWMAPHS